MNSLYSQTTAWRIPQTVLGDCLQEMSIDGQNGNEGIVLWFGREESGTAEITHLVKLRGPLIRKRPDQITIDSALFNDVADLAIEHNVRLLGQIHTHGAGYSLDLSQTDRVYGLQVPFFLSLVAPNYGRSLVSVSSCGVHVFLPGRGYVRLTPTEVAQHLTIISGPHLPFFEIGGWQ
jgi:hypothetical protein